SYVDEHEDSVKSLLLQIDFGRDVILFLNGRPISSQNEREFFKSLGKAADSLTPVLEAIIKIVAAINDSIALKVLNESLSTISAILDGYNVYKLALDVYTRFNTDQILQFYIDDRHNGNGMSPSDAWLDVNNTFGDLLLQISAREKLAPENLN